MLEIPCVLVFKQNGHIWLFGPKFAQEWILGSKVQKSKSGFGMSILEILSAPIFSETGQFWIFGPKFAQKWILGSKFQKSMSGFGISILRYFLHQFSDKTDNFRFLGPNLPKNEFWGWKFGLNLEKLPNYVQFFGSNIVEGVAESRVEAEMSWVEVDGAEWSWMEVKISWVEVDGAGWRRVNDLVIPNSRCKWNHLCAYRSVVNYVMILLTLVYWNMI